MKKDTITFVCTANVCRSPMAEMLMKKALSEEDEPLKSLKIVSTGVSALSGDAASLNSVKALEPLGISLCENKSKRLSHEIINSSIAIFCMTESHRSLIKMYYEALPCEVYLMREFFSKETPELPDPFGQNLDTYMECRDRMLESIPSLIEFCKKEVI